MVDDSVRRAEVAYYYPAPHWHYDEVDQVKALLLFFDQIAILRPRYMSGIERLTDPVLAGPLRDLDILKVLEPEEFVDRQMTEDLATAMVSLLTSGTFDDLDRNSHFQELSQSRVGWGADVGLASMLTEELIEQGLARSSEDGVSIPMHPEVRTTILVLLAQLARAAGRRQGLDLHPTTSQAQPADALIKALARGQMPSTGHLVGLDLEAVTLDLTSVRWTNCWTSGQDTLSSTAPTLATCTRCWSGWAPCPKTNGRCCFRIVERTWRSARSACVGPPARCSARASAASRVCPLVWRARHGSWPGTVIA